MSDKPLLSNGLSISHPPKPLIGADSGFEPEEGFKPRHAHYSSCFLLSYIRFAPQIRFINDISKCWYH